MANKRNCNVPGCNKQAGPSRGLCFMHYHRMIRGADKEAAAEAAKYADPPKRRRRQSAAKPRAAAGNSDNPGRTYRTPRAEKQSSAGADDRIAAITEFATGMGIPYLALGDGSFLFHQPGAGERVLILTKHGHLRPGELKLQPAMETA